eukprot:TRINITY_DN7044_c0_g1_i1.p1 TRINITY_DN7044_c0_g1~~TRINITY_DN7044_c0_g1_i1.p1  ORF type:complete len:1040 (-),score=307.96 TRINITY_DN7044_c0_g1_i1:396-3515(-)
MENVNTIQNGKVNDIHPAKRAKTDAEEFSKWARPPVTCLDKPELLMMQVDVDHYNERPDPRFWGQNGPTKVPVVRMYGVTEEGNSVLAHIHGFLPYFYVPCPEGMEDTVLFQKSLELQLQESQTREKLQQCVLKVEIVERCTLMNYNERSDVKFFKVTVAIPPLVSTCRNICERGFQLVDNKGPFMSTTTYETNITFVLRFMVDRKLAGGGWVQLTSWQKAIRKTSNSCQVEIDVPYMNVNPIEMLKIAPLRIFSFDIECWNQEGKGFPQAKKNPVIQIAVYLKVQGSSERLVHAIWTLRSCAEIAEAQVFAFEDEGKMLMNFRDFIEKTDPDLLTGYNIVNFDLPYLLERAETLGLTDFPLLGRTKDRSRVRINNFGGRDVTDINIEGRVQFDMLAVILKEYKLRSYSLNAVSAEYLGDQKEDVHYSMIGELFTTSAETRRRLAIYCLKDAFLPVQLMDKLLCLFNYVEMARVTGTPINFLINRGQMVKVTSMILRKAQECGFVMPAIKSEKSDDKFEGATVLEPNTGFYEKPITTLDFASLYPSIMMAHNLCYCTLVKPEHVNKYRAEDMTKSPTGVHFMKSDKRKGLLPVILNELLTARKRAKKEMAAATDPLEKMVLNGRQLALKISANSVYGFTGATVGILPCLEISSSVTAFGRTMIEETKRQVEAHYTIQNGYAHDAHVIYGDTDSVFVKFGPDTVAECMKLGEEAADRVSTTFLKPIKLEFEKVYFPYLLLNKKRYAGLYWTNPEKFDKLDTKGIETVRRDNCGLVRQLMDNVLNKILVDRSVEGALSFVKSTISDLLQNKVDLSMLVITKSLGKGANAEDYGSRQAHVELAEKMRKRDPATAPGSGDRVPYVICTAAKNVPACERAEDPLYVLENGLSIDAQYYIEHQLQQPLMRIFGPILPNAESKLFSGEHTRKLVKAAPASGAMARFASKGLRCLGCKALIKSGAFCVHCKEEKAADVMLEKLAEQREKEQEYNRLWTQCQRCQGSFLQPVICSNRDCDIFYRRVGARREIQAIQESMARMQLDCSW